MSAPSGLSPRPRTRAVPLDALVQAAGSGSVVQRMEVRPGDRLIVSTRNSIYSLTARADGTFHAAGGVFARRGFASITVHIVGCTAGGHALFTRCLAAPGLFLEFGDGTRTTRICSVRVVRGRGNAA